MTNQITQTNKSEATKGSDAKYIHINTQASGFINSARLIRKVDDKKNVENHLILKLAFQQGKVVGKDYTKVKTWNYECFVSDATIDKGKPSEHKIKDVFMEFLFPEDQLPDAKTFDVTNPLTDRKITCGVTVSDIRDIEFTHRDGKVWFLIKSNIINAGYIYENNVAIYKRTEQEEQPAEQKQAA